MKITAIVKRGKNKGVELKPHRYQGGYFLVSKGGNKTEFAHQVANDDQLERWIKSGYSVRMSAPSVSPSIYGPESLTFSAA